MSFLSIITTVFGAGSALFALPFFVEIMLESFFNISVIDINKINLLSIGIIIFVISSVAITSAGILLKRAGGDKKLSIIVGLSGGLVGLLTVLCYVVLGLFIQFVMFFEG